MPGGLVTVTPAPDAAVPGLAVGEQAAVGVGVCASARGIAVAVTPGNNGEPAPPRLACAWRYGRTDVRLGAKTGALPRRACRARRDRGAVPAPSAQPLCAQSRTASTAVTTRSAAAGGVISALFRPR
jgi:hypothetical protein